MDDNLSDIEPFTMVLVDWNDTLQFYELVWDGNQKHFTPLPTEPKIWSSSTLYNSKMRKERKQWFNAYILNKELNDYLMFVFRTSAGSDNDEYGVIMDRGFVKTTSITRFVKEGEKQQMNYYDLLKDEHHYVLLKSENVGY